MTIHDSDLRRVLDIGLPPKDIAAEKALKSVRDANEMLLSGEIPFDDEEIPSLVNMLDAEWSYRNQPVMISGEFYYSSVDNPTKTGQDTFLMEEGVLDDDMVMSRGFDIRRLDGEYVLGHLFIFDKTEEGRVVVPNPQASRAEYMGWAPIDDIIIDPYVIPPQLLEEYIKYYFPKAMILIDEIAQEYKDDPIKMIEILKHFNVSHIEQDMVKKQRERNALSAYMGNTIRVRQFTPYSVALKGSVFIVDENQNPTSTEHHLEWQHLQFHPEKLIMIPTILTQDNSDESLVNQDVSSVAMLGDACYVDNASEDRYRRVVIPLSGSVIIESNTENMQRVDTDQLD